MLVLHINRQGDDGSVGPVGDGRMHEAISHTCLSSSAEYELALILKELRFITDQVSQIEHTHIHTDIRIHIIKIDCIMIWSENI